jgi:hypothetical protein
VRAPRRFTLLLLLNMEGMPSLSGTSADIQDGLLFELYIKNPSFQSLTVHALLMSQVGADNQVALSTLFLDPKNATA